MRGLIIFKYELYNYLKEETKKEYQDDTTQNNSDELLTILQNEYQNIKDKHKRYSRTKTLNSFGYAMKEIVQDLQINMKISTVKRLKFIYLIYLQNFKTFIERSFLLIGFLAVFFLLINVIFNIYMNNIF